MKFLFFVILIVAIASCAHKKVDGQTEYPERIGDIAFDQDIDDPAFEICAAQSVLQHYSRYASEVDALYDGEKQAMEEEIIAKYHAPTNNDQNGYITTRFIVNCNGATGRYRVEEMSLDYKPMQFDTKISDQINRIIRELKGWQPITYKERAYDYYMYLSVHIEGGKIIKIMP